MKKYLLIFALGIICAIFLFLGVKSLWTKNIGYRFGTDRAAVINQIKSLNNLETASYSIDKIIELGTDYPAWREFLFGDKILLVAHGKVVAGFDLTVLQEKDFEGSNNTLTLHLPAPRILYVTLDNTQTRVFDRVKGLLTKGDLNLEAQARQQAEEAIRKAACEGNILDEANTFAEQQLGIIFRSAGIKNLSIITQKGNCS